MFHFSYTEGVPQVFHLPCKRQGEKASGLSFLVTARVQPGVLRGRFLFLLAGVEGEITSGALVKMYIHVEETIEKRKEDEEERTDWEKEMKERTKIKLRGKWREEGKPARRQKKEVMKEGKKGRLGERNEGKMKARKEKKEGRNKRERSIKKGINQTWV